MCVGEKSNEMSAREGIATVFKREKIKMKKNGGKEISVDGRKKKKKKRVRRGGFNEIIPEDPEHESFRNPIMERARAVR